MAQKPTRTPLNRMSREGVADRRRLFEKYVMPNLNLVYRCAIEYSMNKSYIDDNYVEALVNLYNYIDTYDPSRPLAPWIHIICKRFVHHVEMRRVKEHKRTEDATEENPPELLYDPQDEAGNIMGVENWRELYGDDILWALKSIKPIYREAFLLQLAGYKLREIAEISCRNGNLESGNIDTVKSRLYLAKAQLQALLTRDGKKRESDQKIH